MKAIVYTSSTGFTKQYAEILAKGTGLNAYTLEDAKAKLQDGDEIVFMGWMCAGSVKSYKKAAKRYGVKAVCAIGMAPDGQNALDELRKREGIAADTSVFYLQGGYAPERLHGIYKIMMAAMSKSVIKKLEAKAERTAEDEETIKMFKQGCCFVSEDNAQPALAWLNAHK